MAYYDVGVSKSEVCNYLLRRTISTGGQTQYNYTGTKRARLVITMSASVSLNSNACYVTKNGKSITELIPQGSTASTMNKAYTVNVISGDRVIINCGVTGTQYNYGNLNVLEITTE